MAFFPGEILKCIVYIAYKMADGTFRFAGTAFLMQEPAAARKEFFRIFSRP
jgi:hypothetical protein